MDRVFSIADHPVDAMQRVAVVIGETDVDQRHIGILHRRQGATPELLHLAWHCRLQNDAQLPGYMTVWVAPSVPAARQRSVAAFCRRVWKVNAHGGIPYAFSRPGDSFDTTTGAFLVGPSRLGLTCASFVLALFDAAGLQLTAYETWPVDRPGDREWQARILDALEGEADPAHIDHLRSEVGAVRFRPEEVAAATALAPPPVPFQDALDLAERILDAIR